MRYVHLEPPVGLRQISVDIRVLANPVSVSV